jgi:hypothetical protein
MMIFSALIFLIVLMFSAHNVNAQRGDFIKPLPRRTPETDREALRLMRNEKLDLILPGAMRDNKVDMWIHVTRSGDPDPMVPQFGSTSGYLIFTDLGDRIERALFGEARAVENIDVRGSLEITRAIAGYDHEPGVFDELKAFIAERDPKTIAVNYSSWISTADGISHSEYLKLETILGPKYSQGMVSAENVITDFLTRRTSREVAAHAEVLALWRQRTLQNLSTIVPGVTRIKDVGGRIYYSAKSRRTAPPDARFWINDPEYVFQRGDFFTGGTGGSRIWGNYMDFETDTKIHAYILREGETTVPQSIQHAWDRGKKAQGIMRQQIKVGMTAGECLKAIVSAMGEAGYVYTPFTDIGTEDYKILQKALANTNKSGFYLDLHAIGNNYNNGTHDILNRIGPTISDFRRNRWHLKIPENHIFAFEYAVHTNLPERPGFPMSINFSNIQVVTNRGVEWIEPPNEGILLIR